MQKIYKAHIDLHLKCLYITRTDLHMTNQVSVTVHLTTTDVN